MQDPAQSKKLATCTMQLLKPFCSASETSLFKQLKTCEGSPVMHQLAALALKKTLLAVVPQEVLERDYYWRGINPASVLCFVLKAAPGSACETEGPLTFELSLEAQNFLSDRLQWYRGQRFPWQEDAFMNQQEEEQLQLLSGPENEEGILAGLTGLARCFPVEWLACMQQWVSDPDSVLSCLSEPVRETQMVTVTVPFEETYTAEARLCVDCTGQDFKMVPKRVCMIGSFHFEPKKFRAYALPLVDEEREKLRRSMDSWAGSLVGLASKGATSRCFVQANGKELYVVLDKVSSSSILVGLHSTS